MFLLFTLAAFGGTNDSTNSFASIPAPAVVPETSREFYNAGTRQFRAGKLGEAETLFQSSIAKQDERTQPAALYNLAHVRFAQGGEELKKAASPKSNAGRSRAAVGSAAGAIQQA